MTSPKAVPVIIMLLCLGCVIGGIGFLQFLETPCEAGKTYFQVHIPQEATQNQCVYNGIQGVEYYLRFDLPSKKFSDFLQETCFVNTSTLSEDYNIAFLSFWGKIAWKKQTWWHPQNASDAISGSCSVNDTHQLHLLVDINNYEKYTLYIVGNAS